MTDCLERLAEWLDEMRHDELGRLALALAGLALLMVLIFGAAIASRAAGGSRGPWK